MSAKPSAKTEGEAKKGGKKKLLILAVPVLLIAVGAGLWFGGILPPLLGMGKDQHPAASAEAHGKAPEGHAKEAGGTGKEAAAGEAAAPNGAGHPPVFLDLPEIVANLNSGPRRTGFIKLKAKLELARTEDQDVVKAAMPRLLDLFQTYLREMRPEELKGAAGTYRLREELIARADIAASPAHVVNVLFTEMLIQ